MTTTNDNSIAQPLGSVSSRTQTPPALYDLIKYLLEIERSDGIAVFYDGSRFPEFIKQKLGIKFVGNETVSGKFYRIYAFPPFFQKSSSRGGLSNVRLVQNMQRSTEDKTEELIDHVLDRLEDDGMAVILVSNSLFTRNYAELQKKLVESKWLIKVVNLPMGAVYPKNVNASLLLFKKGTENDGIHFVDMRSYEPARVLLFDVDSDFMEDYDFEDEEETEMLASFGLDGYSCFVPYADLEDCDNTLNGSLYIGRGDRPESPLSLEKTGPKPKFFLLGQEASIFRGLQDTDAFTIKDEKPDEKSRQAVRPENDRYLRVTDIEDNKIQDTMPHIKAWYDDSPRGKFRLTDRDIVISKTANPVKFALANASVGENVFPAGNIFVIRLNDRSKLNRYYLKSYLETEEGKTKLMSLSSGSSLVSFTKESLGRLEIPYMSELDQLGLECEYRKLADKINHLEKDLKETRAKMKSLCKSVLAVNTKAPAQPLQPSSPDPAPARTAPQESGQSESPQTSGGEEGPKNPG